MPFSYSERKWSLIDLHPDLVRFERTPRYDPHRTFEDRGECPMFLGFDCYFTAWVRPRTEEQLAELYKAVRFDPKTAQNVRTCMTHDPAVVGLFWFQPA